MIASNTYVADFTNTMIQIYHVAIFRDGTVRMWGKEADQSSVKNLKNVDKVYSSPLGGFAAVSKNGIVTHWGSQSDQGNYQASIPDEITKVNEKVGSISYIASTHNAFAAHISYQEVYIWGDYRYGGCASGNSATSWTCAAPEGKYLSGVVSISGGYSTFVALLRNGK